MTRAFVRPIFAAALGAVMAALTGCATPSGAPPGPGPSASVAAALTPELGGGIRGAQVAGRQQRVDVATLFENRDYPVLNEYRAVLGGLMRRMYGLDAAQIDRVFPGAQPVDIALV